MDFPKNKLNNSMDAPGSGFGKQNRDDKFKRHDIYDNSAYSFAKDPDRLPPNGINADNQNKNIWPQNSINETEFHDFNVDRSENTLRSSSETKVSYDVINDSHITTAMEKKKDNRKSPAIYCRVCQGVTIFLVLAVLGLIAFFIIRSIVGDRSSCDTPPSVENGNVTLTQTADRTEATVYCKQGFGEDENQKLTCKDDEWTPVKPCRRTGCGAFPSIANGMLSGQEMKFGSKAKLRCNSGFMVNSTTLYTCLPNGTWESDTESTCFPHPCGQYHLPDHVVVNEDFSHVNMSIAVQCEEGFDFANNSETYIYCDNDTWIGNPKCEVPGKLVFEPNTFSVLISGNPFSMFCTLTHSTKWETVMLARIDQANNSITILTVTNLNGNRTTETLNNVTHFRKRVTPSHDGVSVNVTIDRVQCDNTGLHICSVLVGSVTSPKGIKSLRRQFKAIDLSSNMNEIKAQTSVVQGDRIEVKCSGSIGNDEHGTRLGEMSISIYKGANTTEVQFVVESSKTEDCQIHETINSTILVTNDMNGAELQCLMIDNNGKRQKKSALLNVTTTTVRVSTPSPNVTIGSTASITCELNHIRGWSTIDIRKNCSDTKITIASLQNDKNMSNSTMEKHIVLSEDDVTESSAKLALHFENVTCSDACGGQGGEIEYMCAVKIGESWVSGSVNLEFEMKSSTPVISTEQDKFYHGQEAVIKCTGNVGIPSQNMTIKENSMELPGRLFDSELNLDPDTCANVQTITYTFPVTIEKDGFMYHCETGFDNGAKQSNVETVNVTGPILYFSNESSTAEVGSRKVVQCILTSALNMTEIVISKFGDEICKVNRTGTGSCETNGFSAFGNFSDDGTIFTTVVIFMTVSCKHAGTFKCRSVGIDTLTTSMEFQVKSIATVPELHLPTTIVEGQKSTSVDQLKCTAALGSPEKSRGLEFQIKLNGSDSFKKYNSTFINETGHCGLNASISEEQVVFSKEKNGSTIRCVIVDNDNEVIKNSTEKEVKLLKNVCLNKDAREYDLHPYNCRRYIRCVGERLYDSECAPGSCATLRLSDHDQICSNNGCIGCR